MITEEITPVATLSEEERAELLAHRLLGQLGAGYELLTIELGRRLGLYEVLAGSEPVTASELADRATIPVRYAAEWLDQQAAAGILDVDPGAGDRRFRLSDGHAVVLVAVESEAFMLGAAPLLLGTARTLPAVAEAVATGRGVEYAAFGDELRYGIAALNRPGFVHHTRAWVEQLPDIAARLDKGGTIVDAGCGEGWSSIGLARAFPATRVIGVDLDEASVAVARRHVEEAGLTDQVLIIHANATDESAIRTATGGAVDLVTVYQALHDMGEPIRALATFRKLLAPGGAVLVADEHAPGAEEGPAGEIERVQRAISVLHCLPATWAESTNVVNGTVLQGHTLQAWATDAGFGRLDVLDLEHPFWRFYRLG